MDSLITAAARALAAGDPLGALNRVALRDDAPALALRGIAMARLGDFTRAKELLPPGIRTEPLPDRRGRSQSLGRLGTRADGRAAEDGGRRTRFAHFEGSRWLGRVGRGLFRRSVLRDFERLRRLL